MTCLYELIGEKCDAYATINWIPLRDLIESVETLIPGHINYNKQMLKNKMLSESQREYYELNTRNYEIRRQEYLQQIELIKNENF